MRPCLEDSQTARSCWQLRGTQDCIRAQMAELRERRDKHLLAMGLTFRIIWTGSDLYGRDNVESR